MANTAFYLFVLTAFMILKAMMIPGATVSILESPRFNTIPLTYAVSDIVSPFTTPDCNALVLCLNVVFSVISDFITRIFKVIVDLIEIILNVIAFIVELIALIGALVLTQVPGAPSYINALIITIPAIMLALAIINAFKPGASAE